MMVNFEITELKRLVDNQGRFMIQIKEQLQQIERRLLDLEAEVEKIRNKGKKQEIHDRYITSP